MTLRAAYSEAEVESPWEPPTKPGRFTRVTQTVTAIGWEVHYGQPKTAAGRRPIALDPATVSLLREHRKRMLEQRLLVGDGFVDEGFVFCQPDGSPPHPERVYQAFKRALRRHDLQDIPLHGLRHTWATIALECGVHPRVVPERLGHAYARNDPAGGLGTPVPADAVGAVIVGSARSDLGGSIFRAT